MVRNIACGICHSRRAEGFLYAQGAAHGAAERIPVCTDCVPATADRISFFSWRETITAIVAPPQPAGPGSISAAARQAFPQEV